MPKLSEQLVIHSRIGPEVEKPKPQEKQAIFPFDSSWYSALKIVFIFASTMSAVSAHFWVLAYSLRFKNTKSIADGLFVLKWFMLAASIDYMFFSRRSLTFLINVLQETAKKRRDSFFTGRKIKVIIVIVNICFVSFVISGTVSEAWLDDRTTIDTIDTLTFGCTGLISRSTRFFILVLDTFVYHMNIAFLHLWLSLIYGVIVKIILYEVTFLRDTVIRREEYSSLDMMLTETGRHLGAIRKLVNNVNRYLGGAILVWCVSALIAVCEGITLVFSGRFLLNPLETVTNCFVYFMPTIVIVILSMGICSKVTKEMEDTMMLLQDCSEAAGEKGLTSQLHFLCYRMSVPELALSGGGCFIINRQFALSYICLVLSYSALVIQFRP